MEFPLCLDVIQWLCNINVCSLSLSIAAGHEVVSQRSQVTVTSGAAAETRPSRWCLLCLQNQIRTFSLHCSIQVSSVSCLSAAFMSTCTSLSSSCKHVLHVCLLCRLPVCDCIHVVTDHVTYVMFMFRYMAAPVVYSITGYFPAIPGNSLYPTFVLIRW